MPSAWRWRARLAGWKAAPPTGWATGTGATPTSSYLAWKAAARWGWYGALALQQFEQRGSFAVDGAAALRSFTHAVSLVMAPGSWWFAAGFAALERQRTPADAHMAGVGVRHVESDALSGYLWGAWTWNGDGGLPGPWLGADVAPPSSPGFVPGADGATVAWGGHYCF